MNKDIFARNEMIIDDTDNFVCPSWSNVSKSTTSMLSLLTRKPVAVAPSHRIR